MQLLPAKEEEHRKKRGERDCGIRRTEGFVQPPAQQVEEGPQLGRVEEDAQEDSKASPAEEPGLAPVERDQGSLPFGGTRLARRYDPTSRAVNSTEIASCGGNSGTLRAPDCVLVVVVVLHPMHSAPGVEATTS